MAEQSAHEPTMEEILASIRRIISEDDAPDEAAEPAVEPEPEAVAEAEPEPVVGQEAEEEEDVLELTQPFEPAQGTVSIGDIDAYEPEAAPAPAPKPAPKPAAPSAGLVSKSTEAAAASAFGSLTSNLLVPKSDRTLEDVTRDLLRPLLQAWLDENLPAIVEEQVRLEVERISRQGRG
jgi:cell pole-organizing protein PopZ